MLKYCHWTENIRALWFLIGKQKCFFVYCTNFRVLTKLVYGVQH